MDCIFEFEFSDDVLVIRIFDIQIEGFDLCLSHPDSLHVLQLVLLLVHE